MSPWIGRYCFLAGAVESLTGLLLVAAPAATVALFGVTDAPEDPIFLRFVGVFVGTVGLAYLYPLVLDPSNRPLRRVVVLEVTALVRVMVALFVAVALTVGALALPWATVGLTDLTLALVQLTLLRRMPLP